MANIWYISLTQPIISFNYLGFGLDTYGLTYENFLLPDHNLACLNFGSKNVVKDKTYFKNPENPRCIDLFITNSSGGFRNTTTVQKRLIGCS